ncbi:acyl-CoA dehydrogenase NM domain-like protein [Cristinia sonorae]|uniref:Acyl-CoA dehydrogenase NM domain-like protein n=1 Tax=Cristinia sonorae TaxID=1940300 RepID=A0A8K0UGN0_9AGAR|nr:acyl-CoA dehydrogenase NM domain-like protein [Cristinia sonorae]
MAQIFSDEIIAHTSVPSTQELANSPLFSLADKNRDINDRAQTVYDRARAIARTYGLTAEDVLYLRPKFWALHQDLITPKDGAATTLITIQYNLAAGTLAPFAAKRPELRPLLQQIMNFDVSAQFLLSEVGHGLDAPHLETTATLLPGGDFDLNTPGPQAAKWMPPTGPFGNMPRVALVMARLMVNGEDRGVRPFVVALGNGKEMCKGVSAKVMPTRAGANPVDHAITYFDHVRLPKEALLGSLDKPQDLRQNFLDVIWRVGVGSLALSNITIACLRAGVYVAGKYSIRRTVTGTDGKPMAIIKFRTQQLPILHALAQTVVLDAYGKESVKRFLDPSLDPRVRHGLAASLKAVMVQHCQSSLYALAERCGAQGLFEHNQIIQSQLEMRGVAIAEGDVLALCIRLASELLIGRYEMPEPADPNSLLARHEAGLFEEARTVVMGLGAGHRSEAFNRLVLPLCQPLIESIGHRMAYEAAVKAQVPQPLIDLYVANAVKYDASWYIEHAAQTRRKIAEMEDLAVEKVLPNLNQLLDDTGAGPYCHAPIVSDATWKAFVDSLPHYGGNAQVDLIPGAAQGVLEMAKL